MSNSYSAIRRIHTVQYAECSESVKWIAPHSWSRLAKCLAPAKPPLLLPQSRETIPSSTSHDFIDSQDQRRGCRDLFDRIGGRTAKLLQELPFSSGTLHPGSSPVERLQLAPRLKQAFKSLQDVLAPYWGPQVFFHLAIDECSALGRNFHCSMIVMSFA